MGINLIRYLLKKGEKVVSFDITPFDYPEKNKITAILGDIRNKKDVERAMKGIGMQPSPAPRLEVVLAPPQAEGSR